MQKTAVSEVIDQHRVDRALTAPPLRSNTESSLVATFSLLLGLTHAESRALVKLVKHEHVTRAELHRAMSHNDNPTSGIKIVDVTICGMRKKLEHLHAVKIITVRGQGFRLDKNSRDRLRKILAEYGEDVISAATPPAKPSETESLNT
jgi:DNA-binding response OmpR family regulator